MPPSAAPNPPYRLICLGELSLCTAAPLVRIAVPRKAAAVMAVLAATGERGVTRDRLTELLWPDAGGAGAPGRGALKQSIYELRQALGKVDVVTGTSDLMLDPALVSSDVTELAAAHAVRDWAHVARLYAGPFLAGFQLRGSTEFDHWVDGQRAHCARLFREAIERLAAEAASRQDWSACVMLWRRLAAHEPLDDRVTLALIESLAAAGDRAGALAHYEIHARLLREQLGDSPDAEVDAAAERIRAGARIRLGRSAVSAGSGGGDAAAEPAPSAAPETARVPRWSPPARRRVARRAGIGILTAALAISVATLAAETLTARPYAYTRARVLASLPLPERAAMRVAVNTTLERLYVDGGASFDAQLAVIDARTNAIRTLAHGAGVAIDPITHWYWAGDYANRFVVVRNGRTDAEIGRVRLPGCPYSFALSREWLFVGQQCDDHISVIDRTGRRVIRNIPIVTLTRAEVGGAKGMGEILVNPNTGIAYFSKDGLPQRLDPRTWEMAPTPAFEGPVFAVNEVLNRIYVRINHGLRVFDGQTERLIGEVTLPSTPQRAVVGVGGRDLYVTVDEGVAVLDGASAKLSEILSVGGDFVPDAISLDLGRDRAFVAGTERGRRVLKIVALTHRP